MNIKKINSNIEINTREPLRKGNIPELIKKNIPLSNYPSFKEYGNINLYSRTTIIDYAGLFSFVLYYHNVTSSFKESRYYIGLLIYAEIINSNDFFKNYGMIIYTDKYTFDILKSYFSIYEKVIIAVVEWPKFAVTEWEKDTIYVENKNINKNLIEGTILRCLRYHALEAFPYSDILIRDSDTIFPTEIFSINHAYKMGVKGNKPNGESVTDYKIYMIEIIGNWEKIFIEKMHQDKTHSIILGTNLSYLKKWHDEIPFETNNKIIAKLCRNKKSNLLHFKSPFGIFAGFTNFKKNRPTDLWKYSVDYINSHYEVKNNIISNLILNDYIGKDERIILYTIIPKYWYLCFFFTIYYSDEIEYYTNNNIKKIYNNPCNNIMNHRIVLNLGDTEYKSKESYSYYKKHIKVWTKILDPNFISLSYDKVTNKKLMREYLNSKNLTNNEENKIIQSYTGKTLNQFYQGMFKNFSKKYLEWLYKIRGTSKEEILNELKRLFNLHKNSKNYGELNNLQNKMKDIKFIYNTKLPIIKFSETGISPINN